MKKTVLFLLLSGSLFTLYAQPASEMKQNKQTNLDKRLVALLDTIHNDDQEIRVKFESAFNKFGQRSEEVRVLGDEMHRKDSVNIIKVIKILDKYGWPGPDIAGERGSITAFYVIQHADLEVQEKYLPLVREAVKNKKLNAGMLAMLEDRIALGQGRKQIYGSQIGFSQDGTFIVSPLEDPDNVDKRRAAVGLEPMAEYVKEWNIKWNVEEYKKTNAGK